MSIKHQLAIVEFEAAVRVILHQSADDYDAGVRVAEIIDHVVIGIVSAAARAKEAVGEPSDSKNHTRSVLLSTCSSLRWLDHYIRTGERSSLISIAAHNVPSTKHED